MIISILLILGAIFILLAGLNNRNKIIMLAVIMLPFQQALTIQVGATLRISDLLFILVFILILIFYLNKRINIVPLFRNIGSLYLVYLLISTTVCTVMYWDKINVGLSTLINESNKVAINFSQIILSLMILTVGYYITKNNQVQLFAKIMRVWTFSLIFTSIYIIIQFIILNSVGVWFHLPGEVINEGATFAYGLRRPYGFFIEPGDAGRFLVVSIIMIMFFLENSKIKNIAIYAGVIATFSTLSSIAIFSITSMIFIQTFFNKKVRINIKIALLFLVLGIISAAYLNDFLYQASFGKITEENFSKIDRLNNGTILTKMFLDNPISGIGYGNFGALRNLYGTGTEIPYKEFYDKPNILPYGTLGEQGVIGFILLLMVFYKVHQKIKGNKKQSLLFIIPFIIVFFTSGTILYNYAVLSIGLILGLSKQTPKERIK